MSRATISNRASTSPLIDIIGTLAPLVWLRSGAVYDHTTGTAYTDGESVPYWMDDSVYQRTCVQGTGANQPTYDTAENCLYFDGTNSLLTGELNGIISPRAFLVVAKYDATGNFPDLDGIVTGRVGDNAHRGIIASSGTTQIWTDAGGLTNIYVNGALTNDLVNINAWHIVYGERTDSNYTTGYQIGQDRATTTRRWKGWIKEVILLPAAPSAANRALLISEVNRRCQVY